MAAKICFDSLRPESVVWDDFFGCTICADLSTVGELAAHRFVWSTSFPKIFVVQNDQRLLSTNAHIQGPKKEQKQRKFRNIPNQKINHTLQPRAAWTCSENLLVRLQCLGHTGAHAGSICGKSWELQVNLMCPIEYCKTMQSGLCSYKCETDYRGIEVSSLGVCQ